MPLNSLAGRVAVITGGSKGLGKAIALAIGSAGARVVLIARSRDELDATVKTAVAAGVDAVGFAIDVTDERQVSELAETLSAKFGKIDILVNNAGVNVRKNLTDFTLDDWRLVIETNLTGVFLMCRFLIPLMKGQEYGRVINLTSTMSHVGLQGRTAYCASKAGLLGFTKALALELAPESITVNGISPGPFATEMMTPLLGNPELTQFMTSRIPLGRWGKVEEVGQLALYLCSESSGFITGTDIVIDGGWCAQ